MAIEFNMVWDYNSLPNYPEGFRHLLEDSRKYGNVHWVVIAAYKDFSKGIIRHFIAQEDRNGEFKFFIRIYTEEYKDHLKYNDYVVDYDYLPSAEEIYDMLERS